MNAYELPMSAEIGGTTYDIRSDYRAAIDILILLADQTLTDEDRAIAVLTVFYPDFDSMPKGHVQQALDFLMLFINGGYETKPGQAKKARLMDWQQDFPLIIAPINSIVGTEVRSLPYMHWWTFLAAYREIGDCTFAKVVDIRQKRAQGKKLDKSDQEYYRKHHDLIDLKKVETTDEKQILDDWLV